MPPNCIIIVQNFTAGYNLKETSKPWIIFVGIGVSFIFYYCTRRFDNTNNKTIETQVKNRVNLDNNTRLSIDKSY